jgi:SPP1 gp7 family putative phage head morphogenesis protein
MAKLTEQETIELILLARSIEYFYDLSSWEDKSLKVLLKSVKSAENELLAKLNQYGQNLPSWQEDRMIALLDNFNRMTLGIRYILEGGIATIASEAGASTILAMNDIVSFGGRINAFNETSLTAEQLRTIVINEPVGGKLLNGWLTDTYGAMSEEIRQEVLTGMLKGESYAEFTNRLSNGFDMARNDAVTLVRTYVSSVNNYAMESVYQNNSDIVKKVRWVSTLENSYKSTGRNTCLICALLDGSVYRLDETKPPCPRHPRCRCIFLPILISWEELGMGNMFSDIESEYRPYTIRPNKNIGVGGRRTIEEVGFHDGSYAEWAASQSDKFKLDLLGKRRFELYQSKKINFDDMIDRKSGKLILLKDLINV